MMNTSIQASMLVVFVALATAAEQPLVTCGVPVDVKFIVTPGQVEPEFNAATRPGQKDWSAYKCEIHVEAMDVNSNAAVRQLGSSSGSSDDLNETNMTNISITTTTSTTTSTIRASGNHSCHNCTNSTQNTTNATKASKVVHAELGGACGWKTWSTGLFSLGLSLSLPVATAAPGSFRVPSLPQKVATQVDVVEVLMPCASLLDPLRDLDGDGMVDCKRTQEQHKISVSVPEVDGTWKILSAQSASSGGLVSERHLSQESLTISGGAWCRDSTEIAQWEDQMNLLTKEKLPLALTNVARFTNDAKACKSEEACEATMWSFDLEYPVSSCTPEIGSWVQPCSAKLLADGTLVLVRGAPALTGSDVRRPPLLVNVAHATDALPFANGFAAATQSSFEVLLLHKQHGVLHNAFLSADTESAEVRQLQSNSNSSEYENETSASASPSPAPSPNAVTDASEDESSEGENSTTTTTSMNTSTLKVEAELGQASSLGVLSPCFLCLIVRLALCLLIH